MQQEKKIQQEFHEQILKQIQQNACLNDSEYKDGLYDALNEILDHKRLLQ